jgi:hypothetical protein
MFERDNTSKETTTRRETITRPGDTLTIDIPNIRFKDTTIQRVNYDTRTIGRVVYDSQGNQRFYCIPDEIKEQLELINEKINNDTEKKSDVERSFNPQYLIYSIAGLAGIILIGLVVLGSMIMKIQKNAPMMTAKIFRELTKD